jgi:hypothetical protein
MPRARLISPEFWASEAVVDCPPMTRLLLIGLNNFADDFGVLPLRPRTLRLQVFPGDALDDEQVRAMIEELASRGLVRRYTVDGIEYLSIVGWEIHQRVGKRARRRYPAFPSAHDDAADEGVPASTSAPDHSRPVKSLAADPPPAFDEAADAAWHAAVERAVRRAWGADMPAGVALHAARWRAQGRDLERDVLPAIERVARVAVDSNQPLRLDLVDGAMAGAPPRAAVAQAMASHRNRSMG